jgi:hypothetical protein
VSVARELHINNQTEDNRTYSICEETRSVICLFVTVMGEMPDESIVGELTSLVKTLHVFADLDENMSVVDEGPTYW